MYQSPFCPLLPIKWMLLKRHFFFPQLVCVYIVCVCVCVFYFFHTHQMAKPKTFFFLFGVGGDIICKRDRWWVFWLLIVYTLLAWQFFTLIYIFFRNVEIFNFLFTFSSSKKNNLKENIEHSRKFYLVEMIFQFIYLFIWQIFFEACHQGF